jgi:hypothetical protein
VLWSGMLCSVDLTLNTISGSVSPDKQGNHQTDDSDQAGAQEQMIVTQRRTKRKYARGDYGYKTAAQDMMKYAPVRASSKNPNSRQTAQAEEGCRQSSEERRHEQRLRRKYSFRWGTCRGVTDISVASHHHDPVEDDCDSKAYRTVRRRRESSVPQQDCDSIHSNVLLSDNDTLRAPKIAKRLRVTWSGTFGILIAFTEGYWVYGFKGTCTRRFTTSGLGFQEGNSCW